MRAGGWDPYNVTEDADLGLRLARYGYKTGIISLPTREDGPETAREWFPQRTRWQKGWMQTLLVHMRNPQELMRNVGRRGTLYFSAIMLGFILSPLLYLVSLFIVVRGLQGVGVMFELYALLDVLLFAFGFIAYVTLGFACAPEIALSERLLVFTTLPVYWLILSLAAWRALYQLIRNPHFWEKTPHRPAIRNRDE